ncbi:hypothetical protein BLA29_006188 [Euroglyphus maynei]|uniref:Uncharacterized protein n=1 Tax=Euroglyphus maynei TaxID=6958 RepID=A0A1Y3BDS2_EURMA|nr:hypothetical protein BLA29_006188 [Euroglyphus maynei]
MFGEMCMDISNVRSLLVNDVANAAVAANVAIADVVVDVVVIVGDIHDADAPMVIDTDKDNGLADALAVMAL